MDRIRFLIILLIIFCSCNQTKQKSLDTNDLKLYGFEPVEIQTTAHFRGISVVDSLVVWISGSQGTFVRTVDGGVTWLVDSVPGYTGLDFRDIEAFDAHTAVMMSAGRPGMILKTDNGGESWSTGYYNDLEGIFLNSIAFWNGEEGLAVGDPMDGRFLILTTRNGGETWTETIPESRPEAAEGEYLFAASGTALAVVDKRHAWFGTGGAFSRVFFTKDNGVSWQQSEAPMISGNSSSGIFSLYFADKKNGWAVGGDYTREEYVDRNAILSRNGGKTWQLANQFPSGFRSSVLQCSLFGEKILLCTGPSGTDYSANHGTSWICLESPGYHAMDVDTRGETVWAAGANGRVGRLKYSVTR
jgi:photosystem II stability/assembly factor-like uncharacterized protein